MQNLRMRAAAGLKTAGPMLTRTARAEWPPGAPARIWSDYRGDLANIADQRFRAAGEVGSAPYLKRRPDLHRDRASPKLGLSTAPSPTLDHKELVR